MTERAQPGAADLTDEVALARIPMSRASQPREVARTAAAVAAMQEPSGAMPWTTGEHADVWNHVEAAMALLVGGRGRGRRAGLPVAAEAAARGRVLAGGDPRRRGGRRRPRRGQHDGVPRRRSLAPLAGATRHRLRPAAVATVRAGLDWVVSQQLGFGGIGWIQDRADGGPGRTAGERCWPAPRASTSRCAPGWRWPSCSTTRSRSGSWPGVGSGTPCGSTASCSWTSRPSRWTGTTRSWAVRCAVRRRTGCWTPVGRLRGARDWASAASTPTRG